jgi:hypothetical protein
MISTPWLGGCFVARRDELGEPGQGIKAEAIIGGTASANAWQLEATKPRGRATANNERRMSNIIHLIKIHASREPVSEALTTTEGTRSWCTRDAELDSNIGGAGEFHFYYEGQRVTRVRAHELKPPVLVDWTVLSSFRPEWEERFQRRQSKINSSARPRVGAGRAP